MKRTHTLIHGRNRIRLNIWRTEKDMQARWDQCDDGDGAKPRTQSIDAKLVQAFFVPSHGLPRRPKGIAGELNFSEESIADLSIVAHECVHAALTLRAKVDILDIDAWEESVALAVESLFKAITKAAGAPACPSRRRRA